MAKQTPTETTSTSLPSFNFQGVPVRVDSVSVEGLIRTKDDYIQRHLKPLFKVTTFEDLMLKATEIRQQLERLECFRDIGIRIDTNKTAQATLNGYTVTFRVKEFRRFIGGVNTTVGANEGSLTFAMKLPNLVGRGERLSIDHTIGSIYNKSSCIGIMKPLPGPWNMETSASLFNHTLPNNLSSYIFQATGGLLELNFESAKKVRHSMQYEGSWRQLEPSSRSTSFPVREQSGHSFKSSLRHIMTLDHRDEPMFPTRGILFKLVQEYAGVGGDAAFVKHDSELQVNIPLPYELVVQGSLKMGVLRPLDNSILSHNIHDLFFLGGPSGPSTLRGFDMKSIGSKSQKDFLGGRAYWCTALHLYSRLPLSVGRGTWGDYFRLHAFLNAGNITSSTFIPEDFGTTCQTLLQDFRAAYGLGIGFRLGNAARVELNYCFPLRFLKEDSIVQGVQFGIGIDFL